MSADDMLCTDNTSEHRQKENRQPETPIYILLSLPASLCPSLSRQLTKKSGNKEWERALELIQLQSAGKYAKEDSNNLYFPV